MSLKMTITGRPVSIQKVKLNQKDIICVEFEEEPTESNPKGLPPASNLQITAYFNQKQWNKILKEKKEAGDKHPQVRRIFVSGELKTDFSPEICKGDFALVTLEAKYLPYKPNKEKKSKQKNTNKQNVKRQSIPFKTLMDGEITDEKVQLHKKQDGICFLCGQRCDVKVMHYESEKNERLICLPCATDDKNRRELIVNPKTQKIFTYISGMSQEKSSDYLKSFPSKYVLVYANEGKRIYWTWDEEQPIRQLFVNSKDTIYFTVANENYIKPKRKKKTASFSKRKSVKLKREELLVPEKYKSNKPREEKIKEKIAYYQSNGKFDTSIVVRKEKNGYVIVDGYSRYVASERLQLKECEVVVLNQNKSGVV